MKQQFTYVEPEEYILGSGPLNKPESMQYIPILRTLNALLKHEDVLGQVLENHRSQDGMIRDFCDGDVFKNSPLFQRHENALQIELYDDEFTCTNPLRRRAKKHKLFAVLLSAWESSPQIQIKTRHDSTGCPLSTGISEKVRNFCSVGTNYKGHPDTGNRRHFGGV